MPTRKQRRRREKERRHEWEYVYVDDEGREIAVEEEEQPAAKPGKPSAKPAAKGSGKPATRTRQPAARAARKVEPPSWRRVLRRGAIFAPIMLIVVYLLRPKDASVASIVLQVLVLLVFFLPFSYLMDSLMYRSYRKRIGDPIPPRESRRGSS
jgi:hypothetical protein